MNPGFAIKKIIFFSVVYKSIYLTVVFCGYNAKEMKGEQYVHKNQKVQVCYELNDFRLSKAQATLELT